MFVCTRSSLYRSKSITKSTWISQRRIKSAKYRTIFMTISVWYLIKFWTKSRPVDKIMYKNLPLLYLDPLESNLVVRSYPPPTHHIYYSRVGFNIIINTVSFTFNEDSNSGFATFWNTQKLKIAIPKLFITSFEKLSRKRRLWKKNCSCGVVYRIQN